jgi:hypothetical protein
MKELMINPRKVDVLPTNRALHLDLPHNVASYNYLESTYFDSGKLDDLAPAILFENLRGELPLVYDGNHRFVLAFGRDVEIPGVIVKMGEKFEDLDWGCKRTYDLELFNLVWDFRINTLKNGLYSFNDVHELRRDSVLARG